MKKKNLFSAVAVLLAVFSVLLSGCQKNRGSSDPFSLFSDGFSATLSVEVNGSPSACDCEKQGDTAKITLISPSTLSGFTFNVNGEQITLKTGDTEVDADGKISLLPRLLFSVFSARRENIAEIKTEKTDGLTVTLIKTESSVYRFGADGSPLSVEGVFDGRTFKVTFSNFTESLGGTE